MGKACPFPLLENRFTSCTVQQTDGDSVLVIGKVGMVRAKRAESCFLVPKPHDTVLLALLDDGTAWVLAVLQSKSKTDTASEMRLPDNVALHTRMLTVHTEETTLAADDLRLHGETINIDGKTVGISSRLLTLGGEILLQGFAVVRTFAVSLAEQVARRIGRFRGLDETVEGLARQKAGRIEMTADTSYRLRAENADMRASAQMDIDASSIKVG